MEVIWGALIVGVVYAIIVLFMSGAVGATAKFRIGAMISGFLTGAFIGGIIGLIWHFVAKFW